jgi:hypothetical protein
LQLLNREAVGPERLPRKASAMSWRTERKLARIISVLEWAIPRAEQNPIATDLDEFLRQSDRQYAGDKRALTEITHILRAGKPTWRKGDSPSAWVLQDVWNLLWQNWHADREGVTEEQRFHSDKLHDRATLMGIAWLVQSAPGRWEKRPDSLVRPHP